MLHVIKEEQKMTRSGGKLPDSLKTERIMQSCHSSVYIIIMYI